MSSDRMVSFPNEFLESMNIETTIFTPQDEKIGIAALSETENANITLRLYQLLRSDDNHVYSPVIELAAFSFSNRQDMNEFLKKLPDMTGIEMLMLLNPITTTPFHN
ncbi:hypothetical protein [Oceanobacillus senegalensis]|uniref:hypothetical protein n=1 Tax=Oceanobacillus senegalensis TaxID=1936063 RepID=UPI000A30462C|nr:hypothetical protein [Oceanobacillus senegalensis]